MSKTARINWGLVLTLVATLVAWATTSCRSYAEVEHRISVVETEQQDIARWLERLERKLDRVLERVP